MLKDWEGMERKMLVCNYTGRRSSKVLMECLMAESNYYLFSTPFPGVHYSNHGGHPQGHAVF